MAFQQTIVKSQSIETKLDEVESILGRLSFGVGKDAVDILTVLDQAKLRIDKMVEQGAAPKAEIAQFASVCSTLRKDGREFLRQIGGADVLRDKRSTLQPPRENWWWYLDEELAVAQKQSLLRALRSGGIIVLVLIVAVILYRLFLSPDPQVIAEVEAQQNADLYLVDGNFADALKEIDAGLVKVPDSAELLVYKATILQAMGKNEEAAPLFQRAQDLIANPEVFGLTHAQILNMMNQTQESEALLLALVEKYPNSGRAYLLLGQAYENEGNQTDALAAYEKASAVGEASNDPTTAAQARIKMGMLMQVFGQPQFGLTATPATNP